MSEADFRGITRAQRRVALRRIALIVAEVTLWLVFLAGTGALGVHYVNLMLVTG
jgi:hypothetical protein